MSESIKHMSDHLPVTLTINLSQTTNCSGRSARRQTGKVSELFRKFVTLKTQNSIGLHASTAGMQVFSLPIFNKRHGIIRMP